MDIKGSNGSRMRRKAKMAGSALFLGLIAAASGNSYAQTQPSCSVQVGNNWGSGSQVAVTVNNPGNTPLEDWHIELTYNNSEINNSWNSTREGVNPYLFSAPSWNTTLQANGSYQFGYTANHSSGFEAPQITACYQGDTPLQDEDSDGVEDGLDQCPNTTDNTVDANGCGFSQLDADGDSILNPQDTCPNTPSGETADTAGCSESQRDDDNDGITNGADICPDTQSTNDLDTQGCSWEQRDDDNDGSINPFDACPDTAPGAVVNTGGCAPEQLDFDNDGIHSALDICPSTPEGESPNAEGCSASQLDDDNDGVNNLLDTCPNTTDGTVDVNGCGFSQLDADNDGILNPADLCPATPIGQVADVTGCSEAQRDDDNDGVANGADTCPDTPAEPANTQGCSFSQLDDDNDGILNPQDLCPTTPVGEPVNSDGCPLDDDNDGVVNGVDICPATPVGELVHPDGCADSQLDFDGDGVPGDIVAGGQDSCPDSQAPFNELDAQGCTFEQRDDDNDGINNSHDACPLTPAGEPVDFAGCAQSELDNDGDGVNNSADKCPEVHGDTSYGCAGGADEDQDFVMNFFDACPFTAGLSELNGCKPSFGDFDSDGVADSEDLCPLSLPQEAFFPPHIDGVTAEQLVVNAEGCSLNDLFDDFDGDSIPNGEDVCPETFEGVFEEASALRGCSQEQQRDTDGDGIINGLDKCPEHFGVKAANGCIPLDFNGSHDDFDHDGVLNEEDHCPNSPQGLHISANGCASAFFGDPAPHFELEDNDRDGIPNGEDVCGASLLGHVVNPQGCTAPQVHNRLDEDGNGIINQWDVCHILVDEFGPANSNALTAFGCLVGMEDFDFDGIPAPLDACEHEAGLWLHKGCPTSATAISGPGTPHLHNALDDRDADGIINADDRCLYTQHAINEPFAPSFVDIETIGCSANDFLDDDGDGIKNGHDRCPFTQDAAFLDAEGCSDFERLDADNDQLINGEDLCPQTPGYWRLNGCALSVDDADGDGLPNQDDQCPLSNSENGFAFGPINPETGCAENRDFDDQDGDGVFRLDDACPNSPFGALVGNHNTGAIFEELGCTQAQLNIKRGEDDDADGVVNHRDACPDSSNTSLANGLVDRDGCFESGGDIDGDKVPNEIDACHQSPFAQPLDHEGCTASERLLVNTHIQRSITFNEQEPTELHLVLSELVNELEFSPVDRFQPKRLELPLSFLNNHELGFVIHDFGEDVSIHIIEPIHQAIRIPARIKFENDNTLSNWFEIVISPVGLGVSADVASLIVNDPQLLFDTDIRLSEVFDRLAQDPFSAQGAQLFRQFWDSQRSISVFDTPFFCTGEQNGFPIVCDRPETEAALFDDFRTNDEMNFYTLTAVVNRMDLRLDDWQDCGEHRLVFAAQGHPQGRKFFIFEARMANPTPGDARGCQNTIQFWQDMAQLQGFDKAQRIRQFFMDGDGQPPVISPEHFFDDAGQIRTNQFLGGEWLLKEHKLLNACVGPECKIFAQTVTVKENPFGELFNPDLPFSGSPLAPIAAEFQDAFLEAIDDLAGEFFGDLKMTTHDRFNHGQSHSSGGIAEENDFRLHFAGGFGSPFESDIQFNLQGRVNADGSPLEIDQILARATGLTCGGCHNPRQYGLTNPGSIGSLQLPDGSVIDSWPETLDFVHIDEQSNLSPALNDVFLPIRAAGFGQVLQELDAAPIALP